MRQNQQLNQQGIISILTVTILALILSLITTGFVRAMISNQRQALDYQLNTQAFYAAESGVNDALRIVNTPGFSDPGGYATTCSGTTSFIGNPANGLNQNLNNASNTKYSCILVNTAALPNIEVQPSSGVGKMYPIKSSDTTRPVGNIKIYWGDIGQTGKRTSANYNQFPGAGSWVNLPPVLRVTIYYPGTTVSTADFSRDSLIQNQKTFFLVPADSNLPAAQAYSTDGYVYGISCGTPSPDTNYKCMANLDVANIINPKTMGNVQGGLYLRVVPIYTNADHIKIEGWNGANQLNLVGAQFSVDSTGRANDVYKRISVRKDINSNYTWPEAVVKTQNSLCKQFVVWPTGYSDESGCSIP